MARNSLYRLQLVDDVAVPVKSERFCRPLFINFVIAKALLELGEERRPNANKCYSLFFFSSTSADVYGIIVFEQWRFSSFNEVILIHTASPQQARVEISMGQRNEAGFELVQHDGSSKPIAVASTDPLATAIGSDTVHS